jgi:hypothetical protein
MNDALRGSLVIVRTAGGYARVRRLWSLGPVAAIVAEERAFEALGRGFDPARAGAVGVPVEDVFSYDSGVASRIDADRPFDGWQALAPVGSGSTSNEG